MDWFAQDRPVHSRFGGSVASRAALAPLLSRFALAGAANTGLGLLVIAVLDLGFGLNPHLANAGGYAAGLALSFQLNKRFVFRPARPAGFAGPRFLAAAGCAFALNQAALAGACSCLGPGTRRGWWRRPQAWRPTRSRCLSSAGSGSLPTADRRSVRRDRPPVSTPPRAWA